MTITNKDLIHTSHFFVFKNYNTSTVYYIIQFFLICLNIFLQSKHEPSCIKAANKKRKVFDSAKQRSEGTEVNYRQIKQAQKKVNDRAYHRY